MNRKNPNYKSVFLKVLFTYLLVYFLALVFRYNYDFESLIKNFQYKYLIILNIFSIFLGLPFSIIFDFLLIKLFGLYYILLFTPALTIISVTQVIILRKINFKISRSIYFFKKPEKNYSLKLFENVTFKPFYIFIIRSFPILPHFLGSYIIASSKIKKKTILINTFFGSLLYYILMFLLIGNFY